PSGKVRSRRARINSNGEVVSGPFAARVAPCLRVATVRLAPRKRIQFPEAFVQASSTRKIRVEGPEKTTRTRASEARAGWVEAGIMSRRQEGLGCPGTRLVGGVKARVPSWRLPP